MSGPIGYFAVAFANSVAPDGSVYAFEADPENFEFLRRNRDHNGFSLIDCQSVAVADQSGETDSHRSSAETWGGSLLAKPMHTNKLTVRSRPLDELLADEQRPIRLIKIDVEGAELMVLKGMEQLLQRQSPIPAVIIEFSPKQVEAVDPGMKWFLEYVGRHGFEIHPFISHEAPTVVPAKIKTETLARIYGDFLDQGAVAELDLLLVHPDALGHN